MIPDLQALTDAWSGVGREPVEHGRRKADLRYQWPQLATAIDELTRAVEVPQPVSGSFGHVCSRSDMEAWG